MRKLTLLALTALAGCVTTGRKASLPAVLDPMFHVCAPGDGASTLQIYEGDGLIGSGDLAWTADKGGAWEAEIVSPLGQTLLHVKRVGARLSVTGSLASKLPPVGIRRDGFLKVDGHFIGLRAAEVPCLLGHRLPRPWLDHLTDVDASATSVNAEFEEKAREITLSASDVGGERERVCSEISWSAMLGLGGAELVWCETKGAKSGSDAAQATLTGLKDYSLRWTGIDEP